jgi:hypothetical protein
MISNMGVCQFFDAIHASPEYTDLQKSQIAIKLAETDHALIEGADEFLQLLSMLASVSS